MSSLRSWCAALALSAASLASAQARGEAILLRVGQGMDFRPGFVPAQSTCDDPSVIKIEDAGDHFRITGLQPGKTLCGFTSIAPRGRRRLLELTVRP